jgi:hypothetical protein
LLAQQQETNASAAASSTAAVVQLGATLQVYYHLGELPQAAWSAVDHALVTAEKVSFDFWSATTLSRLTETATTEAKLCVGGSGKKLSDVNVQRSFKKKLKELRAEAAYKWATGIADASLQVWNLHQVLCRKSDPVSRQLFIDEDTTKKLEAERKKAEAKKQAEAKKKAKAEAKKKAMEEARKKKAEAKKKATNRSS